MKRKILAILSTILWIHYMSYIPSILTLLIITSDTTTLSDKENVSVYIYNTSTDVKIKEALAKLKIRCVLAAISITE